MKAVTTEAQYKQYFSDSFQGMNSIIDDVLSPIFGEFTPTTSPTGVDYVDEYDNGGANIDHIYDYGKYYIDTTDVSVFEVVLSERCHISRARKGIKETVSRITDKYSGAFIVFHYPDGSKNAEAQIWRLSWLKRLDVRRNDSPAKRYTYLCGPSYSCRTIAQRFVTLYKEENKTLDSITKAFDAEALSDEFFKEYKVLYDDIIQWITGQRVIKKDNKWQEKGSFGSGNGKDICNDFLKEFENIEDLKEKEGLASKAIRDYMKKLMGRLVFIQFLQKKGYLGIDCKPTQNFLLDLYHSVSDEQKDDFIDTALEQVVYLLLNNEDRKRGSEIINGHKLDVPFLNGGLFERDKWDEKKVKLPKEFFHNEQYKDEKREFRDSELRPDDEFLTQCGILDLFNHYNFTIDENDPDDAELGVDPEMLGKIFENLLEDNKDKGAFYTPKEIVQYMCRESLIAYLQTGIDNEEVKEDVRRFVITQEIGEKLPKDIDQKLQEVKICDPAIGSGAFPMGLLNLLVELRKKLEPATNRCELKKEIIRNNIYGVDIERGAIDIARLRFWLSIMVDEDKPTPLPNFDYKFMQGNSLMEQYKGIDLSALSSGKKVTMQTDMFQGNLKQYQSQLHSLIKLYYDTDDHAKKKELRWKIQENVNEQMKESGVSVNFTELGIDVAGNDQFFLWHTWFQDEFENGKFDIVIGNPPYVRRTKLSQIDKTNYEKKYESATGQYDLYLLFIECGLSILKEKTGILSYINPLRFFNADYGKGCRQLIAKKHSISHILDVSQLAVFKSAMTYPCILFICDAPAKQHHTFCFRRINTLEDILVDGLGERIVVDQANISSDKLCRFLIGTNKSFQIINKINHSASALTTKYFVKRGLPNNKVCFEGTNYDAIKSTNVKKYSIIGKYKKISTNYSSDFTDEMIVMPRTVLFLQSTIKDKNVVVLDRIYYLLPKDSMSIYPILGIINSKLINYWFEFNYWTAKVSGNYFDLNGDQIESLPVIFSHLSSNTILEEKVKKILSIKKDSPTANTTLIEREIDDIVYQIYGLTDDEIKIVKES